MESRPQRGRLFCLGKLKGKQKEAASTRASNDWQRKSRRVLTTRKIVNVVDLGTDAEACNARREEAGEIRPASCPGCVGKQIIGHGWYERWAVYEGRDVKVWVKRWRCKGCGKTISQLPNFLHRYRHYALAVIEKVLRKRLEGGASWPQVGGIGAASQRSMRRWVGVFAAQAMTWLPALMTVLALVMPLASMLDVHGTEVVAPTVAVLQMSYTLADWLSAGIAGVPQDALRKMWRWGWNAGIGRLV